MVTSSPVKIVPGGEMIQLLGLWNKLEAIYAGFSEAARRVEAATGQPICVAGCGVCCTHNVVHAYGVEAEYLASTLLGTPDKLNPILDRCRDWLTAPGKWTYGKKLNPILWDRLNKNGELEAAFHEMCPFHDEDTKTCLVHTGRPAVCRAYGVTRVPGQECKRPIGIIETADSRAWWDGKDPSLPLETMFKDFIKSIEEPRYAREGFLAMMLYERFRANDLAGLLDDGKVPLVKMVVGVGSGYNLLWQDQMEAQWLAINAYQSIASTVKLVNRNGTPVQVIGREN